MDKLKDQTTNSKATGSLNDDDSSRFVIRGFDPGDCFTVFSLQVAEQSESEHDRMWRSFDVARDSGNMVSIGSDTIEDVLLPLLEKGFDAQIPANRDPMNPCALLGREPSFDWYGENTYEPEAVESMLADLRDDGSDETRRINELVSEVVEQAKRLGTEVVFCGP